MSYKAEKEKTEKQLKRIKYIILSVVLLLVAGLGIFSAIVPAETWKYYFSLPSITQIEEGELRIHFIDVGQGDSIFIELPDNKTLLIDGGDGSEQAEDSLMRYLNALQIKKIDYVFVTHSDTDHCGGMDKVLLYKEVDKLYLPDVENFQKNTAYAQLYEAAVKRGVSIALCKRGVSILSDNQAYPYAFTVLYPYLLSDVSASSKNDESSIAWLDYNGVSALFTGDSSTVEESMLMTEDAKGFFDVYGVNLQSTEILKVAHHGSRYATSEEFLRYLHVQTAVISCAADNAYGHPHEETLVRLRNCVEGIYRTDVHGNVVITVKSDGTYVVG